MENSVMYTLLIKPDDKFPCKRKYLHDANNDSEAVTMAYEYAKKKKATIYSLTKTTTQIEDII